MPRNRPAKPGPVRDGRVTVTSIELIESLKEGSSAPRCHGVGGVRNGEWRVTLVRRQRRNREFLHRGVRVCFRNN